MIVLKLFMVRSSNLLSTVRIRLTSVSIVNLCASFQDETIGQERITYQIQGGCTALVAIVFNGKLYVANAGDSR